MYTLLGGWRRRTSTRPQSALTWEVQDAGCTVGSNWRSVRTNHTFISICVRFRHDLVAGENIAGVLLLCVL